MNDNPAGTAPGAVEIVTVPDVIGEPFNVSFNTTLAIAWPPVKPFTGVAVASLLATITFTGVVVVESVLSVVSGSFSSPSTVAVFVWFPVALTVAVITKVWIAPLAKFPTVHSPVAEA